MIDNIDDLREKAVNNKNELKRKFVKATIDETEYNLRITGIGEKSIKIETFIKYEDIMDAIDAGKEEGIEYALKQFIEDYEEDEDNEE